MSNPESVAAFSDKFIVKAKFVVYYLKHLEKTKENVYADYAWKDLCEDSTKLKQL